MAKAMAMTMGPTRWVLNSLGYLSSLCAGVGGAAANLAETIESPPFSLVSFSASVFGLGIGKAVAGQVGYQN